MMRYLLTAWMVCGGVSAGAQEWVDITGGEALLGWTVIGGNWTFEDGAIVGRLTKTPDQKDEKINAWLIYGKQAFSDFEIECEFRTLTPANGGVQLRTHWLPLRPLPKGVAAADAPRDCHGYQANIETRERRGTGRMIDENGRGGLAETRLKAAQTLKQRGWNRMRVVARGGVIETYLHGELANRIEDEAYIGGHVFLQVRADEAAEAVTRVDYRNIRVKDYGRDGAWRPLFDGKSIEGWKAWGDEEWVVEDGAIIGRSGPKKSEGYLATLDTWKDFRVRGRFKMLGEGNFGLFYHATITLREDGYPVIAGVQGEVEPGYPTKSGWVYESYQRGWLVKPDPAATGAFALRPGKWNEIEIRSKADAEASAQHITTWLNGVRVLDFADDDARLHEGAFALQLHTGGVDGIAWKDLCVLDE